MSLGVIYQFENRSYRQIFEQAVDYQGRLLNIEAIDDVEDEPENKVVQVAKVLRSIDYDIKALDEELKRLRSLKSVAENNKEQLKQYIQFGMLALGKKVIDTPTMKISLRKTNPKVMIDSEEAIPDDYFEVKEVRSLDKKLLGEDLKKGIEIEGVYLIQDQTVVIG